MVALALLAATTSSKAQTIINTDFTSVTFPPSVAAYAPVVAASSYTQSGSGLSRQTSGTSPTCSPHTTGGMMRFNSYSLASGTVGTLFSPVLNFSTANTSYSISFWMYRDNGYTGNADKVDVYVNTSAVAGGTLLGTVNRSYTLTPTVAVANAWYQYTYNIPTSYNTSTNYIIFKFTSAYGNNCFVDDIVLTQSVLPNCTGTPTTTASGPSNVCPNTSFTLSCTPVTGAGVTYQWKSASNIAGPYNNIVGATSSSYTVASGIAATTYYQVYTTCTPSGQNYTSNNVTVTALPTYVCNTCTSTATSTGDEEIFNVTIGTLNNSSNCATSNQMYTDYRQTVAAPTLTAGSPYTLSVNFNTCGGYYTRTGAVYMDFNQNGLFTDPGENVWTVSSPTGVTSTTITIPGNATPGITSMRVVYAEQATAPPCGTYTWGETEDYIINVFAPPCTGVPTTTASGPSNVCPNTSFTLTGTAVTGTGVTYQWKSASNILGPYNNIVGATSASYTVASGIAATTYYQLFTTCTASGQTYTSNNVTVNVLPTNVCNICGSTAYYTGDEEIFNVTLNTLNNSSNCSTSNQLYTDYRPLGSLTTLYLGYTYPMSVTENTCGGTYSRQLSAWIDYNLDGSFYGVNETVINNNTTAAANPNIVTQNITVPTTASFGATAMRVLYSEGTGYVDPCTNPYYTWGETEDYVVTIGGIKTTVTGGPFCGGATLNVSYSSGSVTFNAGNVFTAQLSNATGSFATPTNIGTLTSTAASGTIVCTIPTNQTGGSGYRIRVISSNSAVTGIDNGANLTINPLVTPAVSITVSPGTTICAGDNVTFTASPTNGGPTPSYQWYVGATPVGTNSSTYTTTTLANGNQVKVVMTSSDPCPSPLTATSNTITMTVNPLLTPTVNVTSVPAANNVCVGQSVTFTANVTNQGPTPVYAWYKNGNPVGTNSSTYTDNLLVNGDQLTCKLTSNAPCVIVNPVTSSPLTVTVMPNVTPTVSIAANPGSTICAGSNATFTATPVNGGPTPSYQWYVGATPVGSNSPTYSTTTLTNGSVVSCVMTSNASCATPVTATSNSITMTVNPVVTPTISMSTNPGTTICAGTSTTFMASVTNGGATPTYTWTVNGVTVGSNQATFNSNTLNNGDSVMCVMTSSAACPTPASVSSAVVMTVNPVVVPGNSISASPGNAICSGTMTTFTATPVNGGPLPGYQWYKNNVPVGTNSATYNDNTLASGDVLKCVLTSSAQCPIPATATSNNITMTVNPTVNTGVSVSNNTGPTICAGTDVTFLATAVNGGPIPTYQWYVNGNPVGGNSASYQSNTLASGDVVNVTMTSSAICPSPATAVSSSITMTVNPLSYPSVSAGASPGTTICSGTTTTFTATPVNGGPTPTYQWYKNNLPVGTGNTYIDNALNNTDIVYCTMNSSALCPTPATSTSNNLLMSVTTTLTPTVQVTANPGPTICAGSTANFNTQITYGGITPTYQWYVNGNAVTGATQPAFSSNGLTNGDIVSCDMTSSFNCATPATVNSAVTMTVNPVVIPTVSTSSTPSDTICHGDMLTFTAVSTNGGPNPVYVWRKNGNPVGGPTNTYMDNTLVTSDVITCDVMSSDPCPSAPIVSGNSHTITVNEWHTPKSFLDADPSVLMCSGAPITFNATVDSAGPANALSYQWMLNGNPVGPNNASYTANMLNNGDKVYYIMTSTAPCLTKTVDTSKTDTIAWFNSGYLAGVSGTTESNTINITAQNNNLKVTYTDCDLISSVNPSGANPVSGQVDFKVTLDPEVNSFNGIPYVQRHYDIDPLNNASTATATVELYAYENEFIAYNNVASSHWLPLLPTNHVDNGNVRITIFHGTGTGQGPAYYPGPVQEVTPQVSWDVANNWWVMRFPVTGFSGYYIHTGQFPLDVKQASADPFSMIAYPNPVQDKVQVQLTGRMDKNATLVVTDLTGKVLINVTMDNAKALIDMSALASGMYMLKYSDDARTQTVKITKQ
ncbi:MAG: T9SS type A sorting domain-containing protein [Bacteroidetes bacterium]|nr:T9SS type A sorting domain-containing protein [Bacteroidota bacterium]